MMDCITEQLRELELDASVLLNFSKKGTAGRTIFTEHIVPFLSLDNLLVAAGTCRQLNSMCRTYTVGEILSELHVDITTDHKMELGKLIMGVLDINYEGDEDVVHRRLVRTDDGEFFQARLYHPSQLEEIKSIMAAYFDTHRIQYDFGLPEYNWDADTSDSETPVLISAIFGAKGAGTLDVTAIVRYLILKQGNIHLIMSQNQRLKSCRYWYHYILGDPCPRVSKTLWVRLRSGDGKIQKWQCYEDECVKLKVRVKQEDDFDSDDQSGNQAPEHIDTRHTLGLLFFHLDH